MLARRRPCDDCPAPSAQIERECAPRKPSTLADAAGDNDLPTRDARPGGRTRERHAWKRSPGASLEDEDRSQRYTGHRVATEHVRLAAGTDRHGVMDADREVGEGAATCPATASTHRPAGTIAVDGEPPSTTISLPTAAAETSVRGSGIGACVSHPDGAALAGITTTATTRSAATQSLISDGIHFERKSFDPAHYDGSAGIAASRAACLPDLPVDANLSLGPESIDGDAALPDERLDAHRGLPALRPPDESAGLRDLQRRPDPDGDEAPW